VPWWGRDRAEGSTATSSLGKPNVRGVGDDGGGSIGHMEDTAASDARGRAPTDRREADPSITETDATCTSDGGDPAPTHKRREVSGRG
jgi:hypothetical protein